MHFSLFQKKEKECFLALDIGTEAVKALVFQKEDQKYIVLGASSQHFDRFGVFDSRDFEKDIIKEAIREATKEAQNKAKIETSSVILGPSTDILKGRVAFQSFQRKTPKKLIEEKEDEEIRRAVLKEAKQKISQNFSRDSGILPEELEFLSQEILEIKIDGYEVPYLRGYDGKNLEFRILSVFTPKYYLQNLEKIVKDLNLKISKITHRAQNLIKIFGTANAIFLDVGGKITQVFLIKDGKLERVHEFEIGGENFSQALSQALGLNTDRARALKEKYSGGHLSEETRRRIKEIFSDIAQEWFHSLKSKLKIFKGLLPSTFFIFGGGSQLPEIQEILEEGNWETFSFAGPPQIKLLYPKDLKNIVDTTYTLNSPKDINPLLLCYGEEKNF